MAVFGVQPKTSSNVAGRGSRKRRSSVLHFSGTNFSGTKSRERGFFSKRRLPRFSARRGQTMHSHRTCLIAY